MLGNIIQLDHKHRIRRVVVDILDIADRGMLVPKDELQSIADKLPPGYCLVVRWSMHELKRHRFISWINDFAQFWGPGALFRPDGPPIESQGSTLCEASTETVELPQIRNSIAFAFGLYKGDPSKMSYSNFVIETELDKDRRRNIGCFGESIPYPEQTETPEGSTVLNAVIAQCQEGRGLVDLVTNVMTDRSVSEILPIFFIKFRAARLNFHIASIFDHIDTEFCFEPNTGVFLDEVNDIAFQVVHDYDNGLEIIIAIPNATYVFTFTTIRSSLPARYLSENDIRHHLFSVTVNQFMGKQWPCGDPRNSDKVNIGCPSTLRAKFVSKQEQDNIIQIVQRALHYFNSSPYHRKQYNLPATVEIDVNVTLSTGLKAKLEAGTLLYI